MASKNPEHHRCYQEALIENTFTALPYTTIASFKICMVRPIIHICKDTRYMPKSLKVSYHSYTSGHEMIAEGRRGTPRELGMQIAGWFHDCEICKYMLVLARKVRGSPVQSSKSVCGTGIRGTNREQKGVPNCDLSTSCLCAFNGKV